MRQRAEESSSGRSRYRLPGGATAGGDDDK
jgi:hypothetical protein